MLSNRDRGATAGVGNDVALWASLAAVLWGTSYVGAKYVVAWIPPLTAATVRFWMVTVLCWPLMWFTKQQQKVERGDWAGLILVGLFQTSFYFALQYAGIGLTTASNTSVIVNIRPVFVAILSVIVLRESLSSHRIVGIIMAFAGVLVLSTGGSLASLSLKSQHILGDFLILLNAISGAIGLIINKRLLDKLRPFPAMVYTQTFGAIGLIPFAIVEMLVRGSMPSVPLLPWIVLLYQAVFSTILAHVLWNRALARTEASRAAVFIYLAPVTTGVLSWLLLREAIGLPFILGSLLVLGGAYLTNSTPRNAHAS